MSRIVGSSRVSALLCAMVLSALPAQGQARDRKWEVEVHAGGLFSSAPDGGVGTLPPLLGPLNSIPGIESRYVSSWYFGDGAKQLNAFMTSARLAGSLVPVDDVLQSRLADYGSGASLGARVSRQLGARFAAEFTLDMGLEEAAVPARTLTAIEVSRLTYANAWNTVLPGIGAQAVDSVSVVRETGGRPLIATGALLVNVLARGRLTPYLAAGCGVVTVHGDSPSATLEGSYGFTFPTPGLPPLPFPVPSLVVNDRDTIAIRSMLETKGAFLFGGGIKYGLTERVGLRLDLRDAVSGDSQKTQLSASPSTLPPSTMALALIGPPIIVLGSTPFLRDSLSGPPLTDFETFRGDGIVHRINLGAGVYWRF